MPLAYLIGPPEVVAGEADCAPNRAVKRGSKVISTVAQGEDVVGELSQPGEPGHRTAVFACKQSIEPLPVHLGERLVQRGIDEVP